MQNNSNFQFQSYPNTDNRRTEDKIRVIPVWVVPNGRKVWRRRGIRVEVPDAVVVAIVVNAERVFDGRNGVGMR